MEDVALTIAEAAGLLDPPISERRLRDAIRVASLKPVSSRRTGRPGFPDPLYDWADICRLHAAITPWLANSAE